MARASTPTLLSLDKFSEILGFIPSHFNQSESAIVWAGASCGQVMYQFPHQSMDSVSREEVAREIAAAEWALADYLGWPVAPTWISQDVQMYPRHHRPELWGMSGMNVRSAKKSLKARYGKIIEPGQRAVTLIGTPRLAFSDADGDGFSETVTVTQATTLTNVCEVKCYFAGENGDPEWEIRPARTKAISGGNFVATFWAWQFIDPDLWNAIPTATTPDTVVDLDAGASYVATCDVYREYNDPTAVSSTFYWEPDATSLIAGVCSCCGGTGCSCCTLTEQTGCAHIRDAELGLLVPEPATYDENEAAWSCDSWDVCRDPDQVKLYYYCGDLSWLNLGGRRCDGLSDEWARIIAYLAAARLKRPICACGSAGALVEWLQVDLAQVTRDNSYTVQWDELSNPFGTRRGEIEAWRYVKNLARHKQTQAGAV